MADESFEDGPMISTSMATSGAQQQRLFEDPQQLGRFDEATRVLVEQGHHAMVHRLLVILQQPQLDDALRVLNDDDLADQVLDEFCRLLTRFVFHILDAGYNEDQTFQVLHELVLMAAREAAGFIDYVPPPAGSLGNSDGGFGAVPAPAAAVARLDKRTFRAGGGGGGGVTECSICFGDFVDGEEVSVMPCPSRGHEFHPECITKWLGISGTCPLCRHGLAC